MINHTSGLNNVIYIYELVKYCETLMIPIVLKNGCISYHYINKLINSIDKVVNSDVNIIHKHIISYRKQINAHVVWIIHKLKIHLDVEFSTDLLSMAEKTYEILKTFTSLIVKTHESFAKDLKILKQHMINPSGNKKICIFSNANDLRTLRYCYVIEKKRHFNAMKNKTGIDFVHSKIHKSATNKIATTMAINIITPNSFRRLSKDTISKESLIDVPHTQRRRSFVNPLNVYIVKDISDLKSFKIFIYIYLSMYFNSYGYLSMVPFPNKFRF